MGGLPDYRTVFLLRYILASILSFVVCSAGEPAADMQATLRRWKTELLPCGIKRFTSTIIN